MATQQQFIEDHRQLLIDYWNRITPHLLEWKESYEWPKGTRIREAITIRDRLEIALNNDLKSKGYITKKVFDDVLQWGFGVRSVVPETRIQEATQKAFEYLSTQKIADAALALTDIEGVGISRATKGLALSNQNDLAIYDSRAADGLSDLIYNGRSLIPVPPGRAVKGDHLSKRDFCYKFEEYIWALNFFRDFARSSPDIYQHFNRVTDLEIAFFARSRSRKVIQAQGDYALLSIRQENSDTDESDRYQTLGYGGKARPFWAHVDEEGITVLTGPKGNTPLFLTTSQIDSCIAHFQNSDWFPLGNTVDKIKAGGFGEYFKNTLRVGAKFASHFAAILVEQNRLSYRYGRNSSVELKVL